jgi:hypothetical protein
MQRKPKSFVLTKPPTLVRRSENEVVSKETSALQLAWIGAILLVAAATCGVLANFSKQAIFLIYLFIFGVAPVLSAAALFLHRKCPEVIRLPISDVVLTIKTFIVLLLVEFLGIALASYLMAPRSLPEKTPIFLLVSSAAVALALFGFCHSLFFARPFISSLPTHDNPPSDYVSIRLTHRDKGLRVAVVRFFGAILRFRPKTLGQTSVARWPIDMLALALLTAICVLYSPFNPANRIPSGIVDYILWAPNFGWWLALGVVYVLGTNWLRRVEDRVTARHAAWLSWAALLIVGIFVLGLFDDSLYYSLIAYIPYVGPALHNLHSGIPMVDVFSQYGLLTWVIIKVGFAALPISFGSAAALVRVANLAYLFTIALIIFGLSRRRLSALLLTMPVLLVGITFHEGLFNLNALPSTGGMRYLVPAVMVLALTAVRSEAKARILAIPILILASFWSLETFVFTLAPWLSVSLLQCVRNRNFGESGRSILVGIGGIVTAHGLFAAAIFVRTDQLINYLPYIDYFRTFRPDELSIWSIPFNLNYALWLPVWLAFFLVMAIAVLNALTQQPTADTADRLVPVAAFGIASLLYFIGRTTNTTLGLSFLPFAIVMVIAAENLLPDVRRLGRISVVVYLVMVGMGSYMVAFGAERFAREPALNQGNSTVLRHCFSTEGCRFQDVTARIGSRIRALPFDRDSSAEEVLHPQNKNRERVEEIVSQLREFSAGRPRVGLLVETYGGIGLSAFIETGQWYLWDASSPWNDDTSPGVATLVIQSAAQIQDGEVLVIANDRGQLIDMEKRILQTVTARCRLLMRGKGKFHSVFLTEACGTAH